MVASGVRRGRPPMADEAKRASFHTRLRPRLRERLETEARESGRSLSEQIEFRLERACRDDDAIDALLNIWFASPRNAGVLLTVGRVLHDATTLAGHNDLPDWLDDGGEFEAVKLAIDRIFAALRPAWPEKLSSARSARLAIVAARAARQDPKIRDRLGAVGARLDQLAFGEKP